MTRISYFLFAVLLLLSFTGHAKKAEVKLPNVVAVQGDYLYAAVSEVTNQQYLEFVWHQRQVSEQAYLEALPDTAAWNSDTRYFEPFANVYFRHPAYRDYPVVNVSHAQAQAFCAWLTEQLTERLQAVETPIQRLEVRLPTESEWEQAALLGLPEGSLFPWEGNSMRSSDRKHKGQFRANFLRGASGYASGASYSNVAMVTAPAKSFAPNPAGLYNMSGNVAEMIDKPERTKGGSWRSTGAYLQVRGEDPYEGWTEPSPHIGFRYFIEVTEWKPLPPKKETELSAALIESWMRSVTEDEHLLASYTEVTNGMYNLFLDALCEKDPEACDAHQIQTEHWHEHAPYAYLLQMGTLPQHSDYPVVNISHESAVAFCAWLTEVYRTFPNRKYENATFKLPSEQEWEAAARGGQERAVYPWGGPYTCNTRGCYLCNFNPEEMRFLKRTPDGEEYYDYPGGDPSISRGLDGREMLGLKTDYSPNDFGLYQCAGNAAEMIDEPGVSKGGSWTSTAYYIQISSRDEYSNPSASLGFRVFMEVGAQAEASR